jgi:hypothetical protein
LKLGQQCRWSWNLLGCLGCRRMAKHRKMTNFCLGC